LGDLGFTVEEFTASDGYRWRYRRYPTAQAPSAHLVCLHGIQSHAGWYEYSCNWLRRAGYTVSFLDRRGSGMNEQDRGDAPSFYHLLDDVEEFVWAARRPAPALPTFLVGISWGGKLAAALQRQHPGLVDGLALLCPGFFAQVKPSFKQRLAILCSHWVNPSRRFPIPLQDPQLFTANQRWQEFIRHDPLSLREATARLLFESVRLDAYLRRVPGHVRVPVLLLLAEKDRIIANASTRRFVESFATPDKEIVEYPGAHHTLEFEPDPDRFLQDLQQWVERIRRK